MYAEAGQGVDIIITTALIPGKPAPRLITAEMVQSMKPGSVIVDMAAEQGGNCELTVPARRWCATASPSATPTWPAAWPKQSSTLYGQQPAPPDRRAVQDQDGVIDVNMEDDAIRGLTGHQDGRSSPGRRRR